MATKKNNTLLYAGIAAAALLLFKKKDSSMAGVGARRYKTTLRDFYARRGNGYNSYIITYTSPATGLSWTWYTNDEDYFEIAKGEKEPLFQKDLERLKMMCKTMGWPDGVEF